MDKVSCLRRILAILAAIVAGLIADKSLAQSVQYKSGQEIPAGQNIMSWQHRQSDMNGDLRSDIFGRNLYTQELYVWLLNGSAITGFYQIPGNIGFNIELHPADINGDGKGDLFGRSNAGSLYVWLMNGSGVTGFYQIPGNIGANIELHLVDINGDNKSDLFGRDKNTGNLYVWLLNGTDVTNFFQIPGSIGSNVEIHLAGGLLTRLMGSSSYFGVMYARVINTGDVYEYRFVGTNFTSAIKIGNIAPNFTMQVAEINGDVTPDFFIRDKNDGKIYAQLSKTAVLICKPPQCDANGGEPPTNVYLGQVGFNVELFIGD